MGNRNTSKRTILYLLTLSITCSPRALGALPLLLQQVFQAISRGRLSRADIDHLFHHYSRPTLPMLAAHGVSQGSSAQPLVPANTGRICADVCCLPSQALRLRYCNVESEKSYLLNTSFSYEQGQIQLCMTKLSAGRNLGFPTVSLKFGRISGDGSGWRKSL